jgi:hypothetical protein
MEFLETLYQAAKSFIEEIQFRLYHGPIFHRFLNHKYTYYRRLPWKMKIPYLKLVRDHYRYFDFVERDIKLTRAMKAIICCAAAQLVMYLPSESLTFFERIIVYRDYYNSKITHKRHKGEVNPGMKIIVFSWRWRRTCNGGVTGGFAAATATTARLKTQHDGQQRQPRGRASR